MAQCESLPSVKISRWFIPKRTNLTRLFPLLSQATDAPITPSIFPLSDLLLPLLDSNNPNVKARTILYYNLIGRSPPASSPSSFPLGLEPAFVHNDDDEQEADPRALDLAWYKKEWLALGYTEDALRHFGWVEEEE